MNAGRGKYVRPEERAAGRARAIGIAAGLILAVAALVWHGFDRAATKSAAIRAAEIEHSKLIDDWKQERYGLTHDDVKRAGDAFASHYGRRPRYIRPEDR